MTRNPAATATDVVSVTRFLDAITLDPERVRGIVADLQLAKRERATMVQRLRGLADWLDG